MHHHNVTKLCGGFFLNFSLNVFTNRDMKFSFKVRTDIKDT